MYDDVKKQYMRLGTLFADEDYENLIPLIGNLKKLIVKPDELFYLNLGLAEAYCYNGNINKSLQLYSFLFDNASDNYQKAFILSKRAYVYSQDQVLDLSLQDVNIAIQLSNSNKLTADLYHFRSILYFKQGLWTQAIQDIFLYIEYQILYCIHDKLHDTVSYRKRLCNIINNLHTILHEIDKKNVHVAYIHHLLSFVYLYNNAIKKADAEMLQAIALYSNITDKYRALLHRVYIYIDSEHMWYNIKHLFTNLYATAIENGAIRKYFLVRRHATLASIDQNSVCMLKSVSKSLKDVIRRTDVEDELVFNVYRNLSGVHYMLNDLDELNNDLYHMMQIGELNSKLLIESRYYNGLYAVMIGDFEKGLSLLNVVLQQRMFITLLIDVAFLMGALYVAQQKYAEAIHCLSIVIEESYHIVNLIKAQYYLILIYQRQNDYKKSEDILFHVERKMYLLNSQEYEFWRVRFFFEEAKILFHKGEYQKCIHICTEILSFHVDNELLLQVFVLRGNAYYCIEKVKYARLDFEKVKVLTEMVKNTENLVMVKE